MEEKFIKKKSWANQNDEWIVEMEVGSFANGRWNYKTKTFIVDTGFSGYLNIDWDNWLDIGAFNLALPDVFVRTAGGIVRKKRARVKVSIPELDEVQIVIAMSREGQNYNSVGRRFIRKFPIREFGDNNFTLGKFSKAKGNG